MAKLDLRTEKLLTRSVEQYRELLQHAEILSQSLDSCDYSQVNDQALKLQQLQDAACKQDEQLIPLLKDDIVAWKEDVRFKVRLEYIDAILTFNELLIPKIRGVMAVTSVELKKMRGGRTALAGYTSNISNQRGYRSIG